MTATDLQAAIAELKTGIVTETDTAATIAITAVSGLEATDVQGAVAELEAEKYQKPSTPALPASGTIAVQDIAAALVTLGLVTQAP